MAEAEPVVPAETDAPLAPVVRLRSIRTLVVARDLAFRRRATTVLGELGWVGFAVAAPERDVVGMVARMRADVVVLDATAAAPAVARIAADLRAEYPHVGVVLVSEEEGAVATDRPSVRKWGWASDLFNAVQLAYRDARSRELSDDR